LGRGGRDEAVRRQRGRHLVGIDGVLGTAEGLDVEARRDVGLGDRGHGEKPTSEPQNGLGARHVTLPSHGESYPPKGEEPSRHLGGGTCTTSRSLPCSRWAP